MSKETIKILDQEVEHVTPKQLQASNAQWAKDVKKVLHEQQEEVSKAALRQSIALMRVVQVMLKHKCSMTQSEYAEAVGITQAYVSMTFAWYRNATKADAKPLKVKGTVYKVQDIQSFLALLQSGVTKAEMDSAYRPTKSGSGSGNKATKEKVEDSLVRLTKGADDMTPINRESAKKIAETIAEGGDINSMIKAHAMQAQEELSLSGKADAFINLGDSICRMIETSGGLGGLKKGQAEELVRVASEIINSIEGAPGESETDSKEEKAA